MIVEDDAGRRIGLEHHMIMLALAGAVRRRVIDIIAQLALLAVAHRRSCGPTCPDGSPGSRRCRDRPGDIWRGARSALHLAALEAVGEVAAERGCADRRAASRTSVRTWPSSTGTRPRRTVSTSGSSGMAGLKWSRPIGGSLWRRGGYVPAMTEQNRQLRLPRRAGGRKGRPCREVFSSVAARYDLMNDLMSARRPPHLEGRDGGMAQSRSRAGRCWMWRAAPATSPFASPTWRAPAAARPRSRSATSMPQMLGEGVRRAEEKGETAIEWVCGDAEKPAVSRRAFRRLYHRLRHPQCHPYRAGAARGAAGAEAGRAFSLPGIFQGRSAGAGYAL